MSRKSHHGFDEVVKNPQIEINYFFVACQVCGVIIWVFMKNQYLVEIRHPLILSKKVWEEKIIYKKIKIK